jgi:hypothetical protein
VNTGTPNEKLQKLENPKEKKNVGADKKTTTTTEYDSTFTRAVMKLEFDFKKVNLAPNKTNDWGLKDNPCWPSYIAPEDPGYALLTDDIWYQTAANAHILAMQGDLYAKPPSQLLIAEGNDAWEVANPGKGGVPIPLNEHHKRYSDEDINNTFRDRRKRLIHLLDDGFGLREFNTSRRLAPEEVRQHIKVIPCTDRSCSAKRQVYTGENNILVNKRPAIPTLPAINLDTVPTMVSMDPTLEVRSRFATLVSPGASTITPPPY